MASLEWAYAKSNREKTQIFHASIRQVTQFYNWSVKVALGVFPQYDAAESSVKACLKFYRVLGDLASAQDIVQRYVHYRTIRNATWKLSEEIVSLWPEAMKGQTSLSEENER